MPRHNLNQLYLEEKYLKILQGLIQKHIPNSEIWAYGSRVTGKAYSGSDLDLVLRNPQNLDQEVPNWLDFKLALQDSTMPILVDVHLWWQLPETFHKNIEQDYVVLYQGT